jgi:glycosyltransferase involved in cell wall biosynthesis
MSKSAESIAATCKCGAVVEIQQRPYVCQCGMVLAVKGEWVAPKGHLGVNTKRDQLRRQKQATDKEGREAWRLLHECRLGSQDWLSQWKKKIPRGCGCYKNFEDMLIDLPPDFSSEQAWFDWTVAIHNAVNAKLNRPAVSMDRATNLWRAERLYALHSTCEYGGIERWSISLAERLPCYGFVPHLANHLKDQHLRGRLRSVAVDRTIDDVAESGKPVLVSNVHAFRKPKGITSIGVAHGVCEYTRTNICSGEYDQLVAVSDLVAKRIRAWTGRDVTVIANGVDIDRLKPTRSRIEVRSFYAIPEDATIVGMVGRLNEEKGAIRLLDALCRLPNHWGLFIGWGNYQWLQREINARGLTSRCRIGHSIESVGDIYKTVDCVATLADNEGYCLTAMEALMSGVPLVSTNTGIVADLLQQHGNIGASVVSIRPDVDATADAIKQAKPTTIDLSDHTSDAMAERWKEFLSRL